MNRTIFRKIMNDILSRKGRTLLVSASIFIGVLGVIALFSTRDLISQQLEEDIQPAQLAMIEIVVSVDSSVELDNAAILALLNQETEAGQNLAALTGIERVEARTFYPIAYKKPGESEFSEAEIRAYSVPLQDVQIEPMRLVEGEWAAPGQQQVMVERRFAELHGYAVGDQIVFPTVENNQQVEETYTISGIVFHPYSFRGLDATQPGPGVGIYAQHIDVADLINLDSYNRIVARYASFDQALENYEGFQTIISEYTPYIPVFPTYEDPAQNSQVLAAEIYTNVLTSLAIVTMVVSGFLVINVINTIIAEQKKQIGALKAIGATGLEAFQIYAGMALVYGIIGTILGIIPGILVGWLMTQTLATQLDILVTDFDWSPAAVMIGGVLGLLIPVLAAAIPVFNGVRVRIVDAFTDLGISGTYGEGIVASLLNKLPLPIIVKQAISNVYQKRGRLLLTGLTLTMTVATFMATIALTISLNNELTKLFDRLGYQLLVEPNEIQEYERMEQILLEVEGVERLSPGVLAWVQIEGEYVNFFTGNNQLQVYGLDTRSDALVFDLKDGEGWTRDPDREGIIISTAVANQLDLVAGDQLTFTIGGERIIKEVLAVDSNGFDAANMPWRDLATLAGLVTGAPRPNEYTVMGTVPAVDGAVTSVGMDEGILAFVAPDYDAEQPGVVISQELADAAGLGVGDALQITLNQQTRERPVIAVVPIAVLQANAAQLMPAAADQELPAYLVLFGFSDLAAINEADLTGDPVPNTYYVTVSQTDPTAEQVDVVVNNIKDRLLLEGVAGKVSNQVAVADALAQQVSTNTSIIFLAAILIAVVGAIGLLTTLSIAVLERQKEIGVMRSIGASSSTIAAQFVFEGLMVGFISWIVGIPLSYLLARGLFTVFQLENVPFTYPTEALLLGLFGVLAVAALASFGPSMSAARKTVSDILRYQ